MSGMHSDLVMRPVVEAMALPSVRLVMTLHRNSVPPEPIMFTAMPTRMMSVLSRKAKKPISSDINTPVASAARKPQNQLPA